MYIELKMQTFDFSSSGTFSSGVSPEGEPTIGVDPSSKICPNLEPKMLHLQIGSVWSIYFFSFLQKKVKKYIASQN
jgi:hypothetical protein